MNEMTQEFVNIIGQVRLLMYYEDLREDRKERGNERIDRCHACVSYHSLQRQQGTGGHDSWLFDIKQEKNIKERTGRTSQR